MKAATVREEAGKRAMNFDTLSFVVAAPVVPDPQRQVDPKFATPAFDAGGRPIPCFRLKRSYGGGQNIAHSGLGVFQEPVRQIDNHCIYGGYWDHHFGHFLLETLSRLWVHNSFPDADIYFHGGSESRAPHLAKWQIEALNLIKIPLNRIHFISEPILFKSVTIAPQGYVIADEFHDHHMEFLSVVPTELKKGEKIWLSRSALPEKFGRIHGEDILEQRLSDRGWKILSPEKMTLSEQISCVSEAEVISGIEGSALHSIIFLSQSRATIKIIPRRVKNHPVSNNYKLIAEKKNLNQTIWPGGLSVRDNRGYRSDFEIESVPDIISFLDS